MTLSKGGSRYSRKHHGHAGRKHHSKKHHSKKHRAGKHRTRKHHSRKHRRSARVAGMRTSMNTLSDVATRRSTRRTKPSLKARENNPALQREYDSMTRKEREEKEKRRALLRATKKTKKTQTTKKKTGKPQGLSKATQAKIATAFKADPYALQKYFPDTEPAIPTAAPHQPQARVMEEDELAALTGMMSRAQLNPLSFTDQFSALRLGRSLTPPPQPGAPGQGAPAPRRQRRP